MTVPQTELGYALPPPTQKNESARLDVQHRLLILTAEDRLFRAPLDPSAVRSVLDIATGTGIWATDIARSFPDAQVIGFDITSHPQHAGEGVPANCAFQVADLRDDATWSGDAPRGASNGADGPAAAWRIPPTLRFDYVHGRMLMAAVQDWPRLIRRCYEATAPGGWVEFQDLNMPLTSPDPACTNETSRMFAWGNLYLETFLKVGYDFGAASQHAQRMREAGFVDVGEYDGRWTVAGPVPDSDREREINKLAVDVMVNGVAGFTKKAFMEVLGWSEEKADETVAAVVHESQHGKYRILANFKFVYGRKPL